MNCAHVGFGIEQLRDNSTETFWQSDGPQPHLVNIQFPRKITIEDVCIYMDFKADESYTPNRLITTVVLKGSLHYCSIYCLKSMQILALVLVICVAL